MNFLNTALFGPVGVFSFLATIAVFLFRLCKGARGRRPVTAHDGQDFVPASARSAPVDYGDDCRLDARHGGGRAAGSTINQPQRW